MSKFLLIATGFLVFSANWASASSICPAPNGGSVDSEGVSSTYLANTVVSSGVVQNNTGCNVLITFNMNGSVTTTFPNTAASYDAGGDDNLVGIVNNTGSTITTISLSSAQDIFGFDLDGVCGSSSGGQTTTSPGYTFVGGGNPCSHSTDPSGYGGPFTTFHPTTNFAGTVAFGNGGIAAGSSSWFSLEGPVDINISAAPIPGTPEPSTIALMLSGFGGFAFLRRRIRRSDNSR
ncbi:MAG TPA: PEP-CTERM sorting domain-containing protein [Bryobacteraceae bacterium]